ncbi:MAG: FkbM family methyltransferase [Bacteroidetes bacterium]|nr:FkbM family methyltransferase [Bacteroidota bacterium]
MKKSDRIKIKFTRNWNLPGKERIAHWLKPSKQLVTRLAGGIVWLANEDIAIYTTADNYIEWKIITTGTYEAWTSKIIRFSLRPGNVALDIGANIGLQSIRMAQCVGETGAVIAFEPLEYLRLKFHNNVVLNRLSNVTLMPYALSDIPGVAAFEIDPAAWNQGTFNISGKHKGTESQQVDIRVGDDLPQIQTLKRLDVVKVDVEGFEFQVLKGLEKTLEKFRPRILFEFDQGYWRSNGHSITECYDFLKRLGYRLFQVQPFCAELIGSADEINGGYLLCIYENE